MTAAGGAVHDYVDTELPASRSKGGEESFVEGSDVVDPVEVDLRDSYRCVHQRTPRKGSYGRSPIFR